MTIMYIFFNLSKKSSSSLIKAILGRFTEQTPTGPLRRLRPIEGIDVSQSVSQPTAGRQAVCVLRHIYMFIIPYLEFTEEASQGTLRP